MTGKTIWRTTAAFLATVGWSAPGSAQTMAADQTADADPGPTDQSSPRTVSDDIVVTAQRRSQSLQDVPISITALSDTYLRDSGITRTDELQFAVPSVTFLSNNNPQGSLTLVRGVGTFTYSDAVESSVGTVIDGVVLGRQGMGLLDFFDVERVEVLKGPQGTLFGKNASAGLINITTKAPSFTPGAQGEVLYGNFDEVQVNGAVTGPIANGVALRLTGFYHTRDGFVSQPVTGRTLNNLNRKGGRAKLLIAPPGSDGQLTLSAEYYDIDERCCTYTIRAFDPANPALQAIAGSIIGTPGPRNRVTASQNPVFNRSKIFGASALGEIGMGDLTLNSVTGFRTWTNRNGSESDGTPLPILGTPGDGQRVEYDQLSQEVRISSPADRAVYFTAGLYGYVLDTRSAGVVSGNLGLGPPVIPAGFLFTGRVDSKTTAQNYAAFGEISVRPAPKLLLTAGGRLLRETLDASFRRSSTLPLPGNTGGAVVVGEGRRSDTNYVARGVIQYDWSPDVMTYASLSRGYKGFGADTSSPLPGALGGAFGASFAEPETSLSYEIGLRTQFADRRVTLNASAFWTDFDNFQTTFFDATVAQFVLLNADQYRTRGVEGDLSIRPFAGFTLTGTAAYVDAEPVRFPNVPCSASPSPLPCIGGFRNVSGRRAPLSPDFAFNVAAAYETPIGASGAGFFARADYSWKSSILYDFDQDPSNIQAAFGLLNARAGVTLAAEKLRIAAYARNLLDKTYTNLILDTPVFGGTSQYPEIGRTYGVQVNFAF
jgi:iron complex outermembrane receptor protein